MLNPEFNYIWLDFETTWLDVSKDVPIQIWIAQIDNQWNIIEEFQSLIKPSKKTDNLKDIVWFITWLDIEALQSAPELEEVQDKIKKYFNEKTIIIWHNVSFDISFLNNYFPNLKFHTWIDTFTLSQNLIHYAPSYALEVLIDYVKGDSFFKKYTNTPDRSNEKQFHNALEDVRWTLNLFKVFAEYLNDISDKYPETKKIASFHEILNKIIKTWESITTKIEIPKLKKILPWHVKLSGDSKEKINLNELKTLQKYFIWNYNIKDFLINIAGNNQIILCFSNLQKLNCAKLVLNEMWIKNLWFLKDDQVINYEKFELLINKSNLTEEESLFLIKYYSHLMQWYGTIDLNCLNDHKIYYSIKDEKHQTRYPIILATHWGLLSLLDRPSSEFSDYKICFFDVESRYRSYNFYLSNPIDLYYTLNFIEILLYKYNFKQQIDEKTDYSATIELLNNFSNFFQIFIWQIFIETKELFRKTESIVIQHNPIVDNWDFFKTNKLFPQLRETLNQTKEVLLSEDFDVLEWQINKISETCGKLINITKKMYWQSDFYFLYSDATKFTSRWEFIEIFDKQKTYFFSNTNKTLTNINSEKKNDNSFDITNIDKVEELTDYLLYETKWEQEMVFFVVSTRKEESKKIFEDLYQKGIHKKALLLVENITWWAGKNIFKAQTKWQKVIIWWYQFLLNVFSNWIKIDKLIIYNIKGWNESYILDDIKRYATA